MKINDIHLIKGDVNAMFHFPTLTLIEVNSLAYDVFTKMKENKSIESVAMELNLKTNDIETLITNVSKSIPYHPNQEEKNTTSKKERTINRITLHVSNKCNLRCKYCYASGGNYDQPENVMTLDTASKFIDFCTTHFDKVGNIVFFGGEPLLNSKVMLFICESFEYLHKTNKINYMPELGMITNGTLFNDDILNLIKKYIKFITVSIDGPQNLNDFNRKFIDGGGSYSKISEFINKIKTETDVRLKYEATYTLHHSQNNWSESNVKSFLKNEFNIYGTIVPDINIQEDFGFKTDKQTGFSGGFLSILNSMAYKVYKEMCMVGTTIVAISTDGEIYPCHMNYGKKHLSLGNIANDNIFNSQDKYLLRFPYIKSIFKTNKPCIDCWANPICGGCAMRWFFNGKTDKYDTLPNNLLCEINKKQIENILLQIIHLRKDKPKWTELLEKIKLYDDYDYFAPIV